MKQSLMVLMAAAALTACAQPYGPGGQGPGGSGNGPGMMGEYGPGMTRGYGPGMMGGYGPGMMGGYGPGMMGGYGPGMMGGYGPGMMGGYGPGMMGGHGHGMMGGFGPGMMGGYGMAWPADLSADQQARIAEAQQAFQQRQWGLMQQMHQLMWSANAPGRPFDEQAARKHYDDSAALHKQMFENSLELRKRMDAVLTPQQREQMGRGWRR
ncbi:hypothetical protein [Ramlibacter sp.]|uniref:Spy/CpxP family protein refolding chaperone n=1 Tax=Ramlibacter sp. TaxID=1917967 RepID=UPI002D3CCA9A|nr:hypothetical protein [Ramlibacter sp.]HYD76388.1 hypothetical protein [Ramlibacter sp.]